MKQIVVTAVAAIEYPNIETKGTNEHNAFPAAALLMKEMYNGRNTEPCPKSIIDTIMKNGFVLDFNFAFLITTNM